MQIHKAWFAHIKCSVHLSFFCSPSLFSGGKEEVFSFDSLHYSGSLIYAAGDLCLAGILYRSCKLTQRKLALIYITVQLPKAKETPTPILVTIPYRLLKSLSLRCPKCCFMVSLNRKIAELSVLSTSNYQLHGRMLVRSPHSHMALVMD